MATIDGVVFKGIDVVPLASVRLLTPSGHVVSEQTANIAGEFKFIVPNGLWGVEAEADDQSIAVRDVVAMEGERLPVYVCLATGERIVPGRRSLSTGEPVRRFRRSADEEQAQPANSNA